ncbi:MAG: hypothetical protein KJI71_01375 [Patescibacteria group bacterium]|nr:hypothetical protein [Patescibacteria group bacterium]
METEKEESQYRTQTIFIFGLFVFIIIAIIYLLPEYMGFAIAGFLMGTFCTVTVLVFLTHKEILTNDKIMEALQTLTERLDNHEEMQMVILGGLDAIGAIKKDE